jgi:hypothetical protein
VVSANTDGIEYQTTKVKKAHKIIAKWEKETGMVMEHGTYKALYARDVNNYVALYDGYVKAKGVYAPPSLAKNSEYPIVFEAIREYILHDTPLEETIGKEEDYRKFLSMRTVKGGAVWRGDYLGKVVRWYYSKDGDSIHYATNGNKVPKTDRARPMMTLKDPYELDRDKYITLAYEHLADLGLRDN